MTWEVTETTKETDGDVPVIKKQLVGHVDNSLYPAITVDIRLTLTTPANAAGPVPVMMMFTWGRRGQPPPFPPAALKDLIAANAIRSAMVIGDKGGYLVTIKCDVEIDLDVEKMHPGEPDLEGLRELFTESPIPSAIRKGMYLMRCQTDIPISRWLAK